LLQSGANVVLDFGFWRRADRDEARERATTAGADAQLVHVRCAESVARERCRRRSRNPGVSFPIDGGAFESLRSRFEPLESDKAFELVETDAFPSS
jgi:predicted kinase